MRRTIDQPVNLSTFHSRRSIERYRRKIPSHPIDLVHRFEEIQQSLESTSPDRLPNCSGLSNQRLGI